MLGIVHVYKKTCDNNGCSREPSYGIADSRKLDLCSQHAKSGMMDVRNTTCSIKGCSTTLSYGILSSRKLDLCPQHARAGMVNVHKICVVPDTCRTV